MAGAGSRFANAGFKVPKPLIPVRGKPMIHAVLENLNLHGRFIFLVNEKHYDKLAPILVSTVYNFSDVQPEIIIVDKLTEGAACTCLLAKDYLDREKPLMIANCDQLMKWDSQHFLNSIKDEAGKIITFYSQSPAFSYVITERDNETVIKCVEKQVVSDTATTGVYYWRKAKYFLWTADEMIQKNIRVNNEFYVCPTYNEMIDKGYLIKTYPISAHYPIGTPEELKAFEDANPQL